MLYRSSSLAAARRRGVVLLVVMALLALFATVGLSFVFYADGEAFAAKIAAQTLVKEMPEVDPEDLSSFFLSQMIYGTNNQYSAARSWDLARSMYGFNPAALNFTPYNGQGRSALLYPAGTYLDPVLGNNFSAVNYQVFSDLGFQRTPEFTGKLLASGAPDPNYPYRYVGGANPPWTAYDTNSLWLAQVAADGTVLMPSFYRPWLVANAAAQPAANRRCFSVFPDPTWNPVFAANLPDADANGGPQVKNLEFGQGMLQPGGIQGVGPYYNNDSYWIDMGFPVMTAPNGKRYKALFAPLVMDLSNRLHLWAHGNTLGGTAGSPPGPSVQGFGPPEVNLNVLPGVRVPIASATESGTTVTITTSGPHGFTTGQSVMVAGVNVSGYNGTYPITVPTATTFTYTAPVNGLAPSTNGFAYSTAALAELQSLYALRYGAGSLPASPPPAFRPGTWFSMINGNALDQTADVTGKMSNPPPSMPIGMTPITAPAAVAVGKQTVGITQITSMLPAPVAPPPPFPWALQVGMEVTINDGTMNNAETVAVTAVNYAASPPTFTATFAKTHKAGALVYFGPPPSIGFPTYPPGWGNASPAELTNNPLAFNPFAPAPPNIPVLPMSMQEALLRFNGTNSPALTSEIFRRMPATFNNPRSRMMVTLANWQFDRVTSAPYLNFNRNLPQMQYTFTAGMRYPTVGITDIQTVTVTGSTGTFALKYPGQAQTAAITINAGLSAGKVKTALTPTLPAGGTASVSMTVNSAASPPSYVFTITFGGNLANTNVPQLTAVALTGTPMPVVAVATVQNGSALFAAPNYALAATVPTPNSDFSADFRSNLSQFLRVDLTRPLTDYPLPVGGFIPAGAQLTKALADRTQFATDLYNGLVRATGARDPNVNAGMVSTAADYQAARWLAQLAVNIVDYIDDDDYMTPFVWNGANPSDVIFGTELPRLVLNEAYAQQEAGPVPEVNVWAELYNPFQPTPAGATYPLDQGNALLSVGPVTTATLAYTIEIHEASAALASWMRNPANNLGAGLIAPLSQVKAWGTQNALTQQVTPFNPAAPAAYNQPIAIAPAPAMAGAPAGATETSNIVTITTTTPHGLNNPNDIDTAITVTGVTNPQYNGTYNIVAIPSPTTFTYKSASGLTGFTPSGGGNVLFVTNKNNGYYVIGPKGAQYGPNRSPNLAASHVTSGMSVASSSATIAAANLMNTALTGASQVTAGGTTTVTIVTNGYPANFTPVVGKLVTVTGVGGLATGGYNGTFPIASVTGNSFTYVNPVAAKLPNSGGGTAVFQLQGVTLLLRRLANPHLAANPAIGSNVVNAGLPYNPYITVDYLDGYSANPNPPGLPVANAPVGGTSFGRAQPYAAQVSQVAPQVGLNNPPGQPANTFFLQNSNVVGPFDWLVHLDRPPVNPIELLHVSGYRPHELTQQFVNNTGKFQHYAPWNPLVVAPDPSAPSALVYRALDQMSTRYMAGLFPGSRIPGNINLNTMTEPEIFQALCDAHDATAQYPNAWFTQADVASIFQKVLAARTAPAAAPLPAQEGSPFKSFSAASTVANQVNFNDTWFRPDPATGRSLFIPPSAVNNPNAHPYWQSSLLQKIYNNISTTSNVFAIWWTVGYFEVVDESVQPARLGAEIARDQNRHIRHRFFAIVDRSGLEIASTNSTIAVTVNATLAVPQLLTMKYSSTNMLTQTGLGAAWSATQPYVPGNIVSAKGIGAYYCVQNNIGQNPTNANSPYWQSLIQPGMLLEVDTGPNAEVVPVTAASANTFTANFTKSHASGVPIIIRGNPGPQIGYNPRHDSNVVLHLSVIK